MAKPATEDACRAYIGRSRETHDAMAPERARLLEALLDRAPSLTLGSELPPTWHWAYLSEEVKQSDLGADGHERLGLFLPPAPFHRRMWAAGSIEVIEPLRLGAPARRVTTIRDVAFKAGRSGKLCFVELRHEIRQNGAPCLTEDQTIVYRDRGLAEKPLRQPGDEVPEGYFTHAPTRLMRYSAVTHNPHLIHYDRDFCREVEGYPGLVVHGPLLATYLCEALRAARPAPVRRFSFRATAPVFETTPIRIVVAEGEDRAEIRRSDGVVAMTGSLIPAIRA